MIRPTRTSSGLLIVMCLVVVSCSSPSPPDPLFASTPGPAPTVYAGIVMDSLKGNGMLTVSLVTVEGLTSGTWDMSFSGKADPRRFVSGSLNGTVYDAMLTQGSGDDQFGCDWQITASLTLGRLSGSYASRPAPGCPERMGTIDLMKQ